MSCNDCPEITCLCSVPSCAEQLNIGHATASTQYWVHVLKANGAEYIHAVVSDTNGNIIIPLNIPDSDFYNHIDGTYELWVVKPVNGYYNCDCTNQQITTNSGTYFRGSFEFVKSRGVRITEAKLNTQDC